jgi:CubicO group peptidase (beta-lactamase class C family)
MTTDHNYGLPPAVYGDESYAATWGLGWDVRRDKMDNVGILRSPRAFDHSGYCCTNVTCDPDADIVLAFFTVCKTDCYMNTSNFCNMVISAVDD